jgi:glyoxylase-like metal-dependent hydrolase (beta-lactamase superfamily II)
VIAMQGEPPPTPDHPPASAAHSVLEDAYRSTGSALLGYALRRSASREDALDAVAEKLFAPLPDETWVYPGHGNDTTLGAERPHLAEWRERGW